MPTANEEPSTQVSPEARALGQAILRSSGPVSSWELPPGYPTSLALCIIDSIQSIGVTYGSVENVVRRYRDLRGRATANTDGAPELASVFNEIGIEGFITKVGNQHRVSTQPGAKRKAEVIERAADLLSGELPTVTDLQRLGPDRDLEAHWRALPGQRSGTSWRYMLMLAGVAGVKPDRMVQRFTARALSKPASALDPQDLVDLVTYAARYLGISPTLADHLIWRSASGRAPRPVAAPWPGDELTDEHLETPHSGQRVNAVVGLRATHLRDTPAGLPSAAVDATWQGQPIELELSPVMWARYGELLDAPHAYVVADVAPSPVVPRLTVQGIQAV